MITKRKTKEPPVILRTYTVTLADGTNRAFIGTHIEETNEHVIIWNERIAVQGYQHCEYKSIR